MKKVKTVEFFCFMWILIRLFSFCHADSSESETESADVPVSLVINKCDADSFNSKAEVEQFTKVFGHVELGEHGIIHLFNFNFNYSLNGLKNRCKIQTVEIRLHSTSTSKLNATSVSLAENEKKITRAHAEFFDHGFFSYKPNFYINPENYCVKKMSRDILTIEICEAVSTLSSNSDSNLNLTDFPPTLEKCCPMSMFLTIGENQTATCEYYEDPPWKPRNFTGDTEIYPNYKESRPCKKSVHYILPHQLASQIKREENSPIKFKDIRVLQDGGVETRDSGNHEWKELEQSTYCIDGYTHKLKGDEINEIVSADNFMVLQCAIKIKESGEMSVKETVIAVACLISSVSLLLILISANFRT